MMMMTTGLMIDRAATEDKDEMGYGQKDRPALASGALARLGYATTSRGKTHEYTPKAAKVGYMDPAPAVQSGAGCAPSTWTRPSSKYWNLSSQNKAHNPTNVFKIDLEQDIAPEIGLEIGPARHIGKNCPKCQKPPCLGYVFSTASLLYCGKVNFRTNLRSASCPIKCFPRSTCSKNHKGDYSSCQLALRTTRVTTPVGANCTDEQTRASFQSVLDSRDSGWMLEEGLHGTRSQQTPFGKVCTYESALPNISTSFPPKTLKMGTPNSEIGMGREIPANSGFL